MGTRQDTSRKIKPTIGTLSGLVTISRKVSCRKVPKRKEDRQEPDTPYPRVGRDALALPQQHGERAHREQKEIPRVATALTDRLDEAIWKILVIGIR